MSQTESRYFSTARRMDEALIALLSEKPLDFISVKEICERAGVNRSTFYLHYESIGDLLSETVELTNRRFLSYFQQDGRAFIEGISTCRKEELLLATPRYLAPYLTFVRENKQIFRAAFEHPAAMESAAKLRDLYRFVFDPILERFFCPAGQRPYFVQFYLQGIMGVIQEWIRDDCSMEIGELAEMIAGCVRPEYGSLYDETSDRLGET